jgi:hypothetical protein
MRQFILEVFIFTLITMLCISVFGQNWQDEKMEWDEEKGEWVVTNPARGRINADDEEEGGENAKIPRIRPYDHVPWGRYLSWNVRLGKREPTQREIERAKHKWEVKQILTARAMKEAAERKRLLAARRASGWYDYRRAGQHAYADWRLRQYIQATTGNPNKYGRY